MKRKKNNRKILVVTGSPNRAGNTAALVASFAEACRRGGAEVEVSDAARLKYKAPGCIACMVCQKRSSFLCAIKDEASELLARVPLFDTLVIATPVYTFGPSAQVKLFLDRAYSLVKCRGKKPYGPMTKLRLALIASAGGGPEALAPIKFTFQTSARFLGIEFESLLVPYAGEAGSVAGDKAALQAAWDFGARLAR
jgi:multimeric flavodoxin WrbA